MEVRVVFDRESHPFGQEEDDGASLSIAEKQKMIGICTPTTRLWISQSVYVCSARQGRGRRRRVNNDSLATVAEIASAGILLEPDDVDEFCRCCNTRERSSARVIIR